MNHEIDQTMTPTPFMSENFMLESETARRLYSESAESMPIIDYHCHLPPKQIADNHRFANITELWLGGDHYKWRAMRADGIPERYCTGDSSDWEKFEKWAATVPHLLRNQLYQWTHLELDRYFGFKKRLDAASAQEAWECCNERLAQPEFTARGLMEQSGVVLVCTTDDPADTLEHHQKIAADSAFKIKVLPTWRPDGGMAVENAAQFNQWVDRLAALTNIEIRNFDSYLGSLRKRHDEFARAGCVLSDHGLETIYAADYTADEPAVIFAKLRSGRVLNPEEILKFKSAMLYEFGLMDHEKGWAQQFHLGALRNTNTRMFATLGPNTGYDSIGDFEIARPLARLLDRLDRTNQLAKTILYNVNPRDNFVLATMLGNFQDGSIPGKMQLGSAWWFLDQKESMEEQMLVLALTGLLSRFVGMLTDSRSFLSYPRHEYFRRILCNMLARDIQRGLIPNELNLVGPMVRDICYNNAVRYFGFDLPVL